MASKKQQNEIPNYDAMTPEDWEQWDAIKVGRTVYIRTLTYASVGTVRRIGPGGLITLWPVTYIADTTQFGAQFLGGGAAAESESCPVPQQVRMASIVDVWPWHHPVPPTTPA